MMNSRFDGRKNWLAQAERHFSWLAIPNIALIIITLQALGFLFVMMDPIWVSRLALVPELVKQGELWRLVTFLALPLSTSPFWVIFTLLFLYFVLNSIETVWGAFKTTLYVLTSFLITILFSFAFDYPVTQIRDFESTLFLASAALFPEMEIQLYFFIPVKMKWLAWLTLGFTAVTFIQNDWLGRFYLLAIYSNYLIFFGPALLERIRLWVRRRNFKKDMRS